MRATFERFAMLVLILFGSCFCLSVVGQNASRDLVKKPKQEQSAQTPSHLPLPPQTLKQNSPPNASTTDVVSSTKETPASSEVKGSFSELTLFLFASGLGLFVALLGWSDQIRAIDKDTKEMESRFLEDTGMEKRDFLRIIKPESADKQLEALTEMVNAGKFTTKDSVQLLQKFTKWQREWSQGWPY